MYGNHPVNDGKNIGPVFDFGTASFEMDVMSGLRAFLALSLFQQAERLRPDVIVECMGRLLLLLCC